MKVLLTGASGFLGRAIQNRLATDHEIIGLCHQQGMDGLLPCDIRDAGAFAKILGDHRPDAVVHAAAYRDPDFCEDHPEECHRLNVAPAKTLCENLPEGVPLIQVSTDYVYDGDDPPYSEEMPPCPVSEYGRSKVAAENIVNQRTASISLRMPVLVGAGPSLDQSGYIGQLVALVRDQAETDVDDYHVRFPTWIEDVADAVAFLIDRQAEGIFQCSGPTGATRYAAAVEVGGILGEETEHLTPVAASVPRKARRPFNSQLSTDKIRALGYTGFTEFSDVVRHVLATFGQN
jgi:dTDP-4-dehydrorhamnose reductase